MARPTDLDHWVVLEDPPRRRLKLLRTPVGEVVETEPEVISWRQFEGEIEVI